MSAVAFDNTFLSILLNPNSRLPTGEDKTTVLEFAKERAESVIELIKKSRRKIILPAPACAELLTAIGPQAEQYLNLIGRSKIFEIGSFDARCAQELAILNRGVFRDQDKINNTEPYQKRKVDRQIIAICKVYGVTEIYTDDKALSNSALLCGVTAIYTASVPVPDRIGQSNLNLELHEEIPSSEED